MSKKKPQPASEFHGIVLVDKPTGITSHDVVDRVRKLFNTRRVGHTGTLDPQATGLLVMLLGEATRISEYMVGVDKSYEGTIQFGFVSETYDADGVVVPGPGGPSPSTLEEIAPHSVSLSGEILQVPPPYSAKKVGGKKLYEFARKGEPIPEVEPRKIRVDEFEVINLTPEGTAEFGVDCSSGTYVRSLVHELGQKLGCGAILTELRRTDVGGFEIERALTLPALEELATNGKLGSVVLPIHLGLHALLKVYLSPTAEGWLRKGQAIPHNLVSTPDDMRPSRGTRVVFCRLNGDTVGIGAVEPAPKAPPPRAMGSAVGPWYQPVKLFDAVQREHEPDRDEAFAE
jgi:tRNA pseudouridine55 synthase